MLILVPLIAAFAVLLAKPAADHINLEVILEQVDGGFNFPDLATAVQYQVDAEISTVYPEAKVRPHIYMSSFRNGTNSLKGTETPFLKPYLVADIPFGKKVLESGRTFLTNLVTRFSKPNSSKPHNSSTPFFFVELALHREVMVVTYSETPRARLYYTLPSVYSNDLPFLLAQVIVHHLVAAEIEVNEVGVKCAFGPVLRVRTVGELEIQRPVIEEYFGRLGKVVPIELEASQENEQKRKDLKGDLEKEDLKEDLEKEDLEKLPLVLGFNGEKGSHEVVLEMIDDAEDDEEFQRKLKEEIYKKVGEIIEPMMGIPPEPAYNLGVRLDAVRRWIERNRI